MRSLLVLVALVAFAGCANGSGQSVDAGRFDGPTGPVPDGGPRPDGGLRTCAAGCDALMRCVDGLCMPYAPCAGDGTCADGYVCQRRVCLPADRDLDGDGAAAGVDCEEGNPAVRPGAPEDCNLEDDDCDSQLDEDIAPRACSSACGGGTESCTNGAWTGCTAVDPRAETCNGIDEDCDSRIDEGLVRGCTSACGSGSEQCVGGTFTGCSAPPPLPETCDGTDQDCDGVADDGLRTAVSVSTFSALATHQPRCNGSDQTYGMLCNSAIHRSCQRDCHRSGFGPVEQSGNTAYVVCTSGEGRTVSWNALTATGARCSVDNSPSLHCSSAIHRWCAAAGFASGYGPLELSTTDAFVMCVPANLGVVVTTTFTTLASQHAPCNGTREFWGPNCAAATHRFCVSQGYASGFGPVEASGDAAHVVCVRT